MGLDEEKIEKFWNEKDKEKGEKNRKEGKRKRKVCDAYPKIRLSKYWTSILIVLWQDYLENSFESSPSGGLEGIQVLV